MQLCRHDCAWLRGFVFTFFPFSFAIYWCSFLFGWSVHFGVQYGVHLLFSSVFVLLFNLVFTLVFNLACICCSVWCSICCSFWCSFVQFVIQFCVHLLFSLVFICSIWFSSLFNLVLIYCSVWCSFLFNVVFIAVLVSSCVSLSCLLYMLTCKLATTTKKSKFFISAFVIFTRSKCKYFLMKYSESLVKVINNRILFGLWYSLFRFSQ